MEYAYRPPGPQVPLKFAPPELGPSAVFGQFAESDPQRRLVGIGSVVILHVLVIWGLASGLARQVVELLPLPIETRIIEERVVPDEAPPPPPPKLEVPPPPFIPPPEIFIATPPTAPAAITVVAEEPTPPTPEPVAAAPQRQVARVAPEVRAKNCAEPEYPAASQRLGETGSVRLALLVGTDGKVKESRVERSSGFPRLDEAAVAGLSRCRFTPGTVDGVPESAWAQIRYTFRGAR